MTITLRRDHMLILFDLWWFLFVLLTNSGFNEFQLLNIVMFCSLVFIPGFLCMMALGIRGVSWWGSAALAAGLSLLVLMTVGLIGNAILPLVGVVRPLDKPYLLGEISIVVVGLVLVCWSRFEDVVVSINLRRLLPTRGALYMCAPLLFVLMSVAGACVLNNGGSNVLTLLMLFGMAAYAVLLYRASETLDEHVFETALYFMALALLLMTSLRGWYITGHDIQREFKVFELAKTAGLWSMDAYRDAYNACLSITILPTIFSNLLALSDAYVYKVLYQLLFAFCPVLIYLISRNWLTRRMSFLCALYSMAFPTFFEDMPFLARQEIAFLFFGLMLFVLFYERFSARLRAGLFFLLGVGAVLSHYSTTYTILALLFLVLLLRPLLSRVQKRFGGTPTFSGKKISLSMLLLLLAFSFVWTSLITNTSGNISSVVLETLSAVGNGFTENSRSVDAMSLLSVGKPDQTQQLAQYEQNVSALRSASPGDYYPVSTYSAYNFSVVPEPSLPLSPLGIFLAHLGLVPGIFSIGQLIAKLLEVSVILGVIYAFWRPIIFRHLNQELYLLAIAGLLFIALNVIIPVLSTEYGVFRALQQMLFVLVPFLVLGTAVIGLWLSRIVRPLRTRPGALPLVLGVAFLLYATTAIPQLIGGNDPALHLNNTGFYYDNYYLHRAEVYGIAWLSLAEQEEPGTDIEADRFAQNKIVSLAPLGFAGDIFPGTVKKDAFVYLDWTNVHKEQATVLYDASVITYAYPLQFLDDTKDRLYDNGGSRIYK